MISLSALLVVVGVAFLWVVYQYFTGHQVPKGLKELPGPTGYPFIGSLLDFPKTFSYRKLKQWSDYYGPICRVNVLGQTHIIIGDANIANDLLALRGALYSDRPRIVMYHELVARTGALAASPVNKYWRNARKLAGARLSSSALEPWGSVQLRESIRLVCDLVEDTKNYEYLFERYSAVVMLQLLYGKDVARTPEEPHHIAKIGAINRTLERCTAPGAYLVDFLPVLKYLPEFLAPFKTEAKALHEFEYSYFRGLIVEAEKSFYPKKAQEPRALVHEYLDDKGRWDLSDFELAYSCGTLFEGGSGTTSAAMQAFCLAMWHHPHWQDKIQQEIDKVVGAEKMPSFDNWSDLPLVRAAIKETLRWRPVVPGGVPHLAVSDDNYNGFFIPKGAVIHPCQIAMCNDESVYPDAEAYNPDRWLNPKYLTYQEPLTQYPNLKRYLAFGAGRRICPGLELAERSLFIEVSILLWACSVTKKLDRNNKVIPVPWHDQKPGQNTSPQKFAFTLKVRDEKRMEMLREAYNSRAVQNGGGIP